MDLSLTILNFDDVVLASHGMSAHYMKHGHVHVNFILELCFQIWLTDHL